MTDVRRIAEQSALTDAGGDLERRRAAFEVLVGTVDARWRHINCPSVLSSNGVEKRIVQTIENKADECFELCNLPVRAICKNS